MTRLHDCSLEYSPPPGQPALSISYSAGSLSRSSSSKSSHLLKRKRSELAMTITGITVAVTPSDVPLTPIILPDIRANPDEPYVAPPSPVPTEIVDDTPDKTGEELMEAAKAAGVKVRDFAHEPLPKKPRDPRAPEFWTKALESLIMHDRYIRLHPTEAKEMRLPGKTLYRLLAIGWVTREEAERNWHEADWKAVNEYMSRPTGPYPVCIPQSHKRPTAAYRELLRIESYLTREDDVPEECIYVPPDEPGMYNGTQRPPPSVFGLPRATAPAASHRDGSGNDVHIDKRRRVSASGSPPATPPAGSSRAIVRTLSRTASSQLLQSSRSSTPVYEEPPAPIRAPTALRRTETMASIPVR